MERRRRALGLRKPGTNPDENSIKPTKQIPNERCRLEPETKIVSKGKVSQKNQLGCETPKQKTPKHHNNVTPLKPESPCSPLASPGCQLMFQSTLGSPEIEVSWDWSCSQVPKDMLPPKRVKRISQIQPPLPTVNMCPRLPFQRQMTEEENQERLAFYKNILSKSLKSDPEVPSDSKNNNLEEVLNHDDAKSYTTPKRPVKVSLGSRKKDEQVNLLFDDSANEFMFECSQAIEEKLRNGELDMGPIVDIKVPLVKRFLSPAEETKSMHKKVCHGRVNLFPEISNTGDSNLEGNVVAKEHSSSKLPHVRLPTCKNNNNENKTLKTDVLSCKVPESTFTNNSSEKSQHTTAINTNEGIKNVISSDPAQRLLKNGNYKAVERRPLAGKQGHTVNTNSVSNNKTISSNVENEKKRSVNTTTCDRVDKFRKPKNSELLCNNNQSFPKAQNGNIGNFTHEQVLNGRQNQHIASHPTIEHKRPNITFLQQEKSNSSDVSSLLDDDLDLELSKLDVDSLCRNSEQKNIEDISVSVNSVPKFCSQQEIEAKRLAALQKLMMKKKR